MFERVKQDWDKIIYVAMGFFLIFYVSFYFSKFAEEPPKQKTRQIIVTEFFDENGESGGEAEPAVDSEDNTQTSSSEIDMTVEEILDEIHSDADMCKKLSSNMQREIYCNQLDEPTCGVKECCVSLYNKDKEFANCTVGDQMGPTYAQPKTMKFFSYDGENKEDI